jgi:cell shape-determining protein MreC
MKQNQSLKEFIQVKVYDTLQTYLQDLDKYQADTRETAAQLIQTRSQLERERMEKETMGKHIKELREDTRRRIDALERRN